MVSTKDDATSTSLRCPVNPDSPETFGPYTRTLPPSVPLPICWKRNELALLAGCIPGVPLLQEVAAQIMTLSNDLISLLKAGILHRFPSVLSPTMFTWDRWVWAASVHMSRILPASCYLNKDEERASQHKVKDGETFYSPPEIWDELGVMVPLIDMLNHETETSQIKWESPPAESEKDDSEMNGKSSHNENDSVAKVVVHKKVKKGSQIYTNYGLDSNKQFMLRYGFALIGNSI